MGMVKARRQDRSWTMETYGEEKSGLAILRQANLGW
jgi:hypothetical protein